MIFTLNKNKFCPGSLYSIFNPFVPISGGRKGYIGNKWVKLHETICLSNIAHFCYCCFLKREMYVQAYVNFNMNMIAMSVFLCKMYYQHLICQQKKVCNEIQVTIPDHTNVKLGWYRCQKEPGADRSKSNISFRILFQ